MWFEATSEDGTKHNIVLTQHAYHYTRDPQRISGRLYFDGEMVPMRSDREASILALLRNAEIRFLSKGVHEERFDHELRNEVNYVIEYIESPRFLAFAAEQESNEHSAPDQ
jgi:hypothetical protein